MWLHWLLNPHLRLPIESFPRRMVKGFLWFGTFGALLAIALPIVSVSTLGVGDIGARELLAPLWFLGPLLLAPLLFHYLMAPIASGRTLRREWIALLAAGVAPVVAFLILMIRSFLAIP